MERARLTIADAAQAAVADEHGEEAKVLRAESQAERKITASTGKGSGRQISSLPALRVKILAARRDRLLAMRTDGIIGDEAFHRLEEELDFADLASARPT